MYTATLFDDYIMQQWSTNGQALDATLQQQGKARNAGFEFTLFIYVLGTSDRGEFDSPFIRV